jgi:hypothetical protein
VRPLTRFVGATCAAATALAVTASPAAAAHGSPWHWPDSGSGRSVVYVVDHTGPNYPVGTKVTAWNNAYSAYGTQINVQYKTSCPAVDHCGHAWEITSSTSPAPCDWSDLGCTYYGVTSNHMFNSNFYFFNYNVNREPNPTQARAWVACHEIGHMLGFQPDGHRPQLGHCMSGANSSGSATSPDTHDYNALSLAYNHSD